MNLYNTLQSREVIKCGDEVRLERVWSRGELGFAYDPIPEKYIGKRGVVRGVYYNRLHVRFTSDKLYSCPFFVLENLTENEEYVSCILEAGFKIGDKVEYIGQPWYSLECGDTGVIKRISKDGIIVEFDGFDDESLVRPWDVRRCKKIEIGGNEVEFYDNEIVVGCTRVDKETILAIAKRFES